MVRKKQGTRSGSTCFFGPREDPSKPKLAKRRSMCQPATLAATAAPAAVPDAAVTNVVLIGDEIESRSPLLVKEMEVEEYSHDLNLKRTAVGSHADKLEQPVPAHPACPEEQHEKIQPRDAEVMVDKKDQDQEQAKLQLSALLERLPEFLTRLEALDGAYEWDESSEEVMITGILAVAGMRKLRQRCSEVEMPPEVAIQAATLCCAVDSLLKQRERLMARQAQRDTIAAAELKEDVDVYVPATETKACVEVSGEALTLVPIIENDSGSLPASGDDVEEYNEDFGNFVAVEKETRASAAAAEPISACENAPALPAIPAAAAAVDASEAIALAKQWVERGQHLMRMGYNALAFGAIQSVGILASMAEDSLRSAHALGGNAVQGPVFYEIQKQVARLKFAVEYESKHLGYMPDMELGEEALWVAVTSAQDAADGLVSFDKPQTLGALTDSLQYIEGRLHEVGCLLMKRQAVQKRHLQAVVAGTAVLNMLHGAMSRPELPVEPLRPLFISILSKILEILHILRVEEDYEEAVFWSLGMVVGAYVRGNLRWIVTAQHDFTYLYCIRGCIYGSETGLRLAFPLSELPYVGSPTVASSVGCASGATSGASTPLSAHGAVLGAFTSRGQDSEKRPLSRLGRA